MPEPTCGLCPALATRQDYAEHVNEASPWDAANFVLRCADHASNQSWPLVQSEPSEAGQ